MKYVFLPYDKILVAKARELRSKPTAAEKIFWEKVLKSKELNEFVFLRQKPLGHFIVDFYCSKLRLAVEVDGDIHDTVRDRERDNILRQEFGITIIRYRNKEIMGNPGKIQRDLIERIIPPLTKGG